LSQGLIQSLAQQGLTVLAARSLPPNDGGLSLGQAWIAMQNRAAATRDLIRGF